MTTEKIINDLRLYQAWRRGDNETQEYPPDLGKSVDAAILIMEAQANQVADLESELQGRRQNEGYLWDDVQSLTASVAVARNQALEEAALLVLKMAQNCDPYSETWDAIRALKSAEPVDQADGPKPSDCSSDPTSCPDNEGHGCWCDRNAAPVIEPVDPVEAKRPSTLGEQVRAAQAEVATWPDSLKAATNIPLTHFFAAPAVEVAVPNSACNHASDCNYIGACGCKTPCDAAPAVAASEQERIDALREAVIDAADEWSNYVEVDNAPRRCSAHIGLAFDAARAKQENPSV